MDSLAFTTAHGHASLVSWQTDSDGDQTQSPINLGRAKSSTIPSFRQR